MLAALLARVLTAYIDARDDDSREPPLTDRMEFPLFDRPSIDMLLFDNMSDDREQEYFVDGMIDNLIIDISKNPGMIVDAWSSVFAYKGKASKVHEVAEEIEVRYVLEGTARRIGDKVRINA